jgi:hypothetical protein
MSRRPNWPDRDDDRTMPARRLPPLPLGQEEPPWRGRNLSAMTTVPLPVPCNGSATACNWARKPAVGDCQDAGATGGDLDDARLFLRRLPLLPIGANQGRSLCRLPSRQTPRRSTTGWSVARRPAPGEYRRATIGAARLFGLAARLRRLRRHPPCTCPSSPSALMSRLSTSGG